MKKRLGIFVFYDENGIVDNYIWSLLEAMRDVLTELIVAINGKVVLMGEDKFRDYTNNIYYRNNIGYDAGAYKDIICMLICNDSLKAYDELVLFNDTFFGPFYPINDYFDMMNNDNSDFWGFGKWTDGYASELNCYIKSHIQSWFVVFRSSLLHSSDFAEFWMNLEYPQSYGEAVKNFEERMSVFFTQRGYMSTSYIDKIKVDGGEKGGQVYYEQPLKLIKEYKFPFLKYKHVLFPAFKETGYTIEFLRKNIHYDTSKIWEKIVRKNNKIYNLTEIIDFFDSHKKIYIFGDGNFGKMIYDFLLSNNRIVHGFLTSKSVFQDLTVDDYSGVIVAVGVNNLEQAKKLLLNYFTIDNLLFPKFKK